MIFGTGGFISADDVCFERRACYRMTTAAKCENFAKYFHKRLKEPMKTNANEPVRKDRVSADHITVSELKATVW